MSDSGATKSEKQVLRFAQDDPSPRFAQDDPSPRAAQDAPSFRGEKNRERKRTALLGVHEGTAYFLLYNGVLGDKRPRGGDVLTRAVLAELEGLLPGGFAGGWVV